MYNSTLSLTSALDGRGWSTPRPDIIAPGIDPAPIVQEAVWALWPVWTDTENLPPPPPIPGPSSPLASRYTV